MSSAWWMEEVWSWHLDIGLVGQVWHLQSGPPSVLSRHREARHQLNVNVHARTSSPRHPFFPKSVMDDNDRVTLVLPLSSA